MATAVTPASDTIDETTDVLWAPHPDARETTRMGAYLTWLESRTGNEFSSYEDAWHWSVTDLDGFWRSIWEYFDLAHFAPPTEIISREPMPRTTWFRGARVNYAAQALRHPEDATAVIAHSQTREPVELTFGQLRDEVSRCAQGLRQLGVGTGDRVAAYMPNIPETLVLFLASASIGAVFSSCPPEFGTRSVIDRFSQIDPKVLVVVDGYRYGAKNVDRSDAVDEIRQALPRATTVVVPYLGTGSVAGATDWAGLLDHPPAALEFAELPFDHPLYILYSSGTTGLPKPIVHGHGGIMIEHVKTLGLHLDLGPDDRFFWFSTTGWMVWNFLISGLLTGSALVLFDGNPGYPDLNVLWSLAEQTKSTYVGMSAPFIVNCMKADLRPGDDFDLSSVRGIGSTGAPLPAAGFRWVYEHVADDIVLGSASGGTDVCTAFVGACPLLPVYAGEIPCRLLGSPVEAFDGNGEAVIGEVGELVVTGPMPSMPVGFWGDDDDSRYHNAYFAMYPGVWRHGDWIRISDDGTCLISGRSDATLNRGGLRMGTSDFYNVLDTMPEIVDSLVVHLPDDGPMGRLILFVVLADGMTLDDEAIGRIRGRVKQDLSPRHLPDDIVQIPVVPRTLTGKRLELPVKRLLLGAKVEDVVSPGALQDARAITAVLEVREQLV